MTQGGLSYFPLRVNTAGVIPPIFASSLLVFPSTIAQVGNLSSTDTGVMPTIMRFIQDYLGSGGWLYNSLYVALIIFFAFFYTAIVINPDDVADNLKRQGRQTDPEILDWRGLPTGPPVVLRLFPAAVVPT